VHVQLLERFKYKNGIDWPIVAWNWRQSCSLTEAIHWKRCLRFIASSEQYARVSWAAKDYFLVQKSLSDAVFGAIYLLSRFLDDAVVPITLVPSWRVAGWERAIAACEVLQSYGRDNAGEYITRARLHCHRAFALLDTDGDPKPPRLKVAGVVRLLCGLGDPKRTLHGLACPSRRARTVLRPSPGADLHDDLEDVIFLPPKHSSAAAKRATEHGHIHRLVEIINHWAP
jgi:hypothetical protein